MWFWNQYTTSECDRRQSTASPLRADREQLTDLPATMILNGEADVLRDEGEEVLNSLDQTKACRAAMDVSVDWVNRKNEC